MHVHQQNHINYSMLFYFGIPDVIFSDFRRVRSGLLQYYFKNHSFTGKTKHFAKLILYFYAFYQRVCQLTHFNLFLALCSTTCSPILFCPPSLPPTLYFLQHGSDSSPLIPTNDSVSNPYWDHSSTPTITLRLHPDRMEMMSLKSALCCGGFNCFRACVCGRQGWMGACVNKPICPSKC